MENQVVLEKNTPKEIDIWKKKLLDLGKRNNLINFKDSKSTTLEILSPSFSAAFKRITSVSSAQIYDDIYDDLEDILNEGKEIIDKEEYIKNHKNRVPANHLLLFNPYQRPKRILRSLMRKANDSLTERGVNILYISFGFVSWKEKTDPTTEYKAPLLLVPITITNDAYNKPYFIHLFDDDVSLNQTFEYLLENQYGIKLKKFEEQDIEDYISDIELQLLPLGWKVIREAKIGIFSFNKLNMYLDLEENKDEIITNPNIKALTNNDVSSDIFINREEMDELSKKRDLFINQHNVVDADFSQTEAIEYAMMGKSFVLQGPPGTGKSQTITNIIAELIYSGKKVLFVSEKMAALEVVYNNLKKAKLSDFCLELHSYKANKKDFIDELYKTLNTSKTIVKEDANVSVSELNEALRKINEYDSELYKLYEPINMSLYQLIGFANHLADTKEVPFIIEDINKLGKDELNRNCNLLNKYYSFEKTIGYNYKNHSLYGLLVNDSSYAFKLELGKKIEACKTNCEGLINTLKTIKKYYSIELLTSKETKEFISFVNFCLNNRFTNNSLYNSKVLNQMINSCDELNKLEKEIKHTNTLIDQKYTNNVYSLDFKNIYDDFISFGNSFLKRLFNSRYKNAKLKLLATKLKRKIKYNEAIDDLRLLIKREENINKYNELSKAFEDLRISQFKYLDTNWDKLKKLLKELNIKLFELPLKSGQWFANVDFSNHNDKYLNKLSDDYNKLTSSETQMDPYFDKDVFDYDFYSIKDKKDIYDDYYKSLKELDNWIDFNKLLVDLKQYNLLKFVDLVIENNYKLKDICDYYRLCFFRQWIDYIFKSNSKIYNYSRYDHEHDINTFNDNDELNLNISRARINEKLSKMRPDPLLQMAGSPASIITREHEKKRKLKPIRLLMKEIPNFIQELKPCFLMSPLSVSTYLSDEMKFDVTIFDEASQVFPEDAIVAIYRSKQLIVVGDSKQMPPTNFFMANDNEDDEYDDESSDIDSYESILDLCSTTFPTKSLLCHYRSKDEGLITFSNKNFYNYNLVTYPSVYENKKDLGVDFEYVEGGVLDSRSKINLKEAERVVDLIFEHYKKYPNRSLGVVAFNIKQQEAIIRLLEKRRSENQALEEYFSLDREEPFFVKNLETVQGDERDTIIFSVTYAKNEKGRFALRFGPLNLIGGERRLNVAITRAKLNVKVVSSIRAYDIDITKVSNVGPKLLHDYLDYAEHGVKALDRAISVGENEEFDSPFEQDVYEFLKKNGFDVTTQVGCSKYRIDLGLKRPNTSDYVLAIECDGATYHFSKSARDRDRLRQSVLEKMNWKFYRIWSTDWYKNTEVEKKALLDACNEALSDTNYKYEKEKPVDISSFVEKKETKGSVKLFDPYIPYNKREKFLNGNEAALEYVKAEGPVAVDYLLKQICYIWGYAKSTQRIKDIFKAMFKNTPECKMEDGFLYGPNQKNYAMRANIGEYLGDINYISDYEIRNGMYATIEMNVSCKKEDLFTFIKNQLGFSRGGEKINKKLEVAFILLTPYISVDADGDITINKERPLEIIRR